MKGKGGGKLTCYQGQGQGGIPSREVEPTIYLLMLICSERKEHSATNYEWCNMKEKLVAELFVV
jgi:hypothetical protein